MMMATASLHSLLIGAPALARSHPEPSSNPVQLSFSKATKAAALTLREIAFGRFRLFPTQFLLLEGEEQTRLGSRALEILAVLLERPGELVSKQELMDRVWPNVFVEPANLTVHISALRRKLHDGCDGNRFIINVPGRGYSFVAPVEVRHVSCTGVDEARRCAARHSSGSCPHRVDREDHVRWSDPQTRQSHW